MKFPAIIVLTCLCMVQGYGQSKKELTAARAKSSTEWTAKKEDGKTVSYKSLYEEYDKNGNTTLHIEYDEGGTILLKEITVFDKYKRISSETVYEAAKGKTIMTTYLYDAFNNVTEEKEFSGDKLIKKTVCSYNSKGQKNSEITYDGSGDVLKKSTYTYDSKNLKTGRSTVNTAKQTETTKKWVYTYF
ncbi:MAG TPA: hypothetical protein PLJ84_03250 [Bacteroidales bacterium]|nr:hypothetical protein [Bacteroidales bacterium]HPT01587.1 hypothetical protein [Bacteroidales bacterium]